jgi:excisionase family DNA binding protein
MPFIEANVPVMFDVKTVARILSISRSSVYELIKSGELGSLRIGRSRRVSQNQLVEYILGIEDEAKSAVS